MNFVIFTISSYLAGETRMCTLLHTYVV